MTLFQELRLDAELGQLIFPKPLKIVKVELEDDDKITWVKRTYEFIKKILMWCKEKLSQLMKYTGNKLGSWIRGRVFHNSVKKIKALHRMNFLKEVNGNELLILALNPQLNNIQDENVYLEAIKQIQNTMKVTHLAMEEMGFGEIFTLPKMNEETLQVKTAYHRAFRDHPVDVWSLLVNQYGKIRQPDEIIRNTKNVIKYLSDPATKVDDFLYRFNIKSVKYERFAEISPMFIIPICLDGGRQPIFDIDKQQFDISSLDEMINHFEPTYRKIEGEMTSLSKGINVTLAKVNQEVDRLFKTGEYRYGEKYYRLIDYADKLQLILSMSYVSIYYYANLTRFIEGYKSAVMNPRFMTTIQPPALPLYYLSSKPGLGLDKISSKTRILRPYYPDTGRHEILPKRISFAPSPEQCCYGLGHRMEMKSHGGMKTVYFYSYKAKPISGKTRYIKPEIVKAFLIKDGHLSQEVCVTTEIEIIPDEAVAVTYNERLPLTHPHRYSVKRITIDEMRYLNTENSGR